MFRLTSALGSSGFETRRSQEPTAHTLYAGAPGAVDEAESGPGAHVVALQTQCSASDGAPHIRRRAVRRLGGLAAGTSPCGHALSGVLTRRGCC